MYRTKYIHYLVYFACIWHLKISTRADQRVPRKKDIPSTPVSDKRENVLTDEAWYRGIRGGCLRSWQASLSQVMAPFRHLSPSCVARSSGLSSLSLSLSLGRRRPSLESLLRQPNSSLSFSISLSFHLASSDGSVGYG